MLRAIAAIIAGYVVMAFIVVVTIFGAALALGPDRAFRPASFEPAPIWIGLSISFGLVAAIAGGSLCALIAKPESRAPMVLALMVLVVGGLLAMNSLQTPHADPGPRTKDLSTLEAMTQAQTPAFLSIVNPIVGAIGVGIGAAMRGRPPTRT